MVTDNVTLITGLQSSHVWPIRMADKQRIAEWMRVHNANVFDDTYLAPSYNIAPQTFQPVVRLDPESGERELTFMRWGLMPFWSKDGTAAFNTINAKAETVATAQHTVNHGHVVAASYLLTPSSPVC